MLDVNKYCVDKEVPPRRRFILFHKLFGWTNNEIAKKCNVSEKTVKFHTTFAYNDLKGTLNDILKQGYIDRRLQVLIKDIISKDITYKLLPCSTKSADIFFTKEQIDLITGKTKQKGFDGDICVLPSNFPLLKSGHVQANS